MAKELSVAVAVTVGKNSKGPTVTIYKQRFKQKKKKVLFMQGKQGDNISELVIQALEKAAELTG